jgi:hypothetical protein
MVRFDVERFRDLLFKGATTAQISAELSIGETTCRRHLRSLNLTTSETAEIKNARGGGRVSGVPSRFAGNNDLLRDIRALIADRTVDVSALEGMTTAEKGRVGELLVKYQFARRGIRYAEMPSYAEDLVVMGSDGGWKTCEIKACAKGYNVAISRMRYRSGEHVRKPYDGVDFYVLVTLETEEFFVVPFLDVPAHVHSVCCSPFGFGWKYRFRTDLF